MSPSAAWYLLGSFTAVALVTFLGTCCWWMFCWWMSPRWARAREDSLRELYEGPELNEGRELNEGLAIFRDAEDYGLLCPAAATDDPDAAEEIRGLLAAAGIRSTSAACPDGCLLVLVFPEEAEEARRLVGGSPAV